MRNASALVLLSFLASPVLGAFNVTIDDEYGDAWDGTKPIYAPDGTWNQGNGCDFCSAKPNASNPAVVNGTWQDTTYVPNSNSPEPPSVQMTFNGTAVYVYMILDQLSFTNLTFDIDGARVGVFTWDPPPPSPNSFVGQRYNQLAFAKDGLKDSRHTLKMGSEGLNESMILFDYAQYTRTTGEDTPTPSTSSTSTPAAAASRSNTALIGGVVGGVVGGLAILALIGFLLWRRRKGRQRAPQPFTAVAETPRPPAPVLADEKNVSSFALPTAPSSSDLSSSVPSSSRRHDRSPSRNALRAEVLELRSMMEAMRIQAESMRVGQDNPAHVPSLKQSSIGETSTSTLRAPDTALQQEIASLRDEMTQLRGTRVVSSPAISSADVMSQISGLRAELEDLRGQQERGILPDYWASNEDPLINVPRPSTVV